MTPPLCTGKTTNMATPVFVDTGAHDALADVQDPDHDDAVRLLHQMVRLRYALVTSNFVLAEVSTLVRQRLGREAAMQYVEGLRAGAPQVISVSTAEEERA
jgi:predicted nucleic acid-binding protein